MKGPSRSTRLVLASALVALALRSCADRPSLGDGEVVEISGAYAFDLTDPEQLAGYADSVFIGRVMESRNDDSGAEPTTFHTVEVVTALKSELPATVTVGQKGGTRDGVNYLLEGQPLLEVGQMYALSTTGAPPAALTLLAGPISADKIPPGQLKEKKDTWKQAVRLMRYPEALTGTSG